jgi:hypothetical protein
MKKKKGRAERQVHTKGGAAGVQAPSKAPSHSQFDLIDPTSLLLEAVSNGLEAGCADIDDREIPRASNVVEWLTSPKFLNIRPFPKQIEDAIHIFSAACYMCSDTDFLVNIPIDEKLGNIMDRTVLMKRGKCPRCGRTVPEMRREWCLDPANCYGGRIKPSPPNDVVALEGQRSGKSTKTAMYATYVLHRFLMLPNPGKYFGLLESVGALHSTFVSVTTTQAWENLWQPFSDLIDTSPWFQKYHNWLTEKGQEVGAELWNKPDTYLWYAHKRLGLSFAAADQRTLRGRTRFMAAVDEIGWFGASKDRTGTSRVRADGDGTVRALDRSLATIRHAATKKRKKGLDAPDAYLFTISSPSSATDPIMRRYKKAENSPRMYYIKRPTWEANPTFTEESLRTQEGDSFERDFQCDFAVNPPYSDDPWWENESALLGLCSTRDVVLWTGAPEIMRDPTGDALRWLFYKFSALSKDKHTPRCLSFDTGLRHNSFAWAVGGLDKGSDTVVVEDVGELSPGPNERIHHGLLWDHVIKPLVESMCFYHVVWDRWESSRYVADLRTKYKIRSEQYSATMKDGKNLRSDMLNSKILLPKPECSIQQLPIGNQVELARRPRAHLLLQCMTARDGNGLPLKPEGGNDDLLRSVLLLQTFIRDNADVYGRLSRYSSRAVGIGVGGRVIGGMPGRGAGVVMGNGGRAIGIGPRY